MALSEDLRRAAEYLSPAGDIATMEAHEADRIAGVLRAIADGALPFQPRMFGGYTANQLKYIRIGWNKALAVLNWRRDAAGVQEDGK
jgi:hypothetical protein